mgnify:CR=1 FL=1
MFGITNRCNLACSFCSRLPSAPVGSGVGQYSTSQAMVRVSSMALCWASGVSGAGLIEGGGAIGGMASAGGGGDAVASGGGAIVNMAGVAGLVGSPNHAVYGASKHAIHGFLNSLRIELRGSGVSVTIIAPDFVATMIHDRGLRGDGTPMRTPLGQATSQRLQLVQYLRALSNSSGLSSRTVLTTSKAKFM